VVNPWDKRDDEDAPGYERFLSYLYCKPRSIDRAYNAYLSKARPDEAPKGAKRRRAPGQWDSDSRLYSWKERAVAWDIEQLSTIGASATTRFIDALDTYAALVLDALISGKIKPKDWQEATDALRTLGAYINADAIAALRDRRNGENGSG
jgi:hypothetical protein